MKKLSDFIIEKRLPILITISLITLFFGYKVTDLKVHTKFADLLPQGDLLSSRTLRLSRFLP